MKFLCVVIFALLFSGVNGFAAENIDSRLTSKVKEHIGNRNDGWTQVEIPGFFSIDIPSTMELQGGAYKKFKDKLANIILPKESVLKGLVFQQSGLNNLEDGSTRRYARIIISNSYDPSFCFRFTKENLSRDVLKHLEAFSYKEAQEQFNNETAKMMGMKMIKWYPVQACFLGGHLAYKIKYLRKSGNNPSVLVECYKISNGHYSHEIIFSYRQAEESFWKDDFEKVKKRIKIYRK